MKNDYNISGRSSYYLKKFGLEQQCGPTVHERFTLVYVLKGKGVYTLLGKVYELKKGHIFIVEPNVTFSFKADKDDPWELGTIEIAGTDFMRYLGILNLTSVNPIREYNKDDYFEKLCDEMSHTKELPEYIGNVKLRGLVLLFFSKLMELFTSNNHIPRTREEMYIYEAIKYIRNNFKNKYVVNAISKHLGLDRSHFSKLFKSNFGISPQKYIIQYKMDKACEMLANTMLGVGCIASLVGYSEYYAFSKTFKRIKGISPVPYRKSFNQTYNDLQLNRRRSDIV